MTSGVREELDFIEELRLRRWARENYAPRDERQQTWHPIVHDEMARKDGELSVVDVAPSYAVSRN
jgi:hypothetical protein